MSVIFSCLLTAWPSTPIIVSNFSSPSGISVEGATTQPNVLGIVTPASFTSGKFTILFLFNGFRFTRLTPIIARTNSLPSIKTSTISFASSFRSAKATPA